MEPASAEKILKAFHILDPEGKGTLSKEYIGKLMSEEGEPFTQVSSFFQILSKNNFERNFFIKFQCKFYIE